MSVPATPTLERLADAVAERLLPRLVAELGELLEQQARPPHLVDAAELAQILGVARSWIYEHADLLDPVPLGNGDKPRLRFDVDRARAALAGRPEPPAAPDRPSRRRRSGSGSAPLLPVHGDSP